MERSSSTALLKALCRLCAIATLAALIFAQSAALGYLTAVLQWNQYRIPIFCAALALMLNGKRLLRLARRTAYARGNQHTYHGIAVPDLARFLQETGSFKRDEALKRLGLSQGQYAKIAQELEEKGILTRGEANARVMRPIGREHLVQQLRDGFPLVWDPNREIWIERDGEFNRWVLAREFDQRKLDEKIEKKERKLERLQERVEELAPVLAM